MPGQKKNTSGLHAAPFFAQPGPDNLFGWAVLWLADLSHPRCARTNFAIKMRHVQGSQVSPKSMCRIFVRICHNLCNFRICACTVLCMHPPQWQRFSTCCPGWQVHPRIGCNIPARDPFLAEPVICKTTLWAGRKTYFSRFAMT